MTSEKSTQSDSINKRLPTSIWGLGFVSLFMDISSELVHSLLPIFMTTVLGTSMVTIGLIEGFAEATAAVTKVFSGAISDYFKKRKLLTVIGYSLSAFTKPIFPLVDSINWVFGARFADRIGKGIRGAPRDALVADITPPELRGAAYGLRQSLDSVGAFVGPLLAMMLLLWFTDNIRTVLWAAVVPAFIAVFLLVFMVKEPDKHRPEHETDSQKGSRQTRLTFADITRLPVAYWLVVIVGAVFTLARFSEAFLIIRAQDLGLGLTFIPLILIVMNIVYSICAYPAGAAADRMSARKLLIAGLLMLVTADLLLAFATSYWFVFLGAAFWGLHMAFTQGLLSKLVADKAPEDLRGTAFGVFNLIHGIALFLASAIAGLLWNLYGAAATFFVGAFFALLAILGLALFRLTQSAQS